MLLSCFFKLWGVQDNLCLPWLFHWVLVSSWKLRPTCLSQLEEITFYLCLCWYTETFWVIRSVLTCIKIPNSGTTIMGLSFIRDVTQPCHKCWTCLKTPSKENVKTCSWFFSISYPFLDYPEECLFWVFFWCWVRNCSSPQGKRKHKSLLSSMKASTKGKRNGK